MTASGFRLPPSVARTLPSGMRLFATEFRDLPLIDFVLIVEGAGSVRDPEGKEGLAGLTAGLLRRGTESRSASRIAEEVDFVGGTLDAEAGRDASRLTGEFLAKDADLAIDMITDILVHPAFAEEEVSRLKGEILSDLKAIKENPSAIAARRFNEVLYDGHPYGHPTSGWENTVEGLDRADAAGFHERHYAPDRVILVAAGDFVAAEMLDKLERRLGGWQAASVPVDPLPAPAAPRGRTVYLVDKPGSTQTQIRIGGLGMRRTDPDYIETQVANTIFGGGFTSRLVQEIRVNRGLSYGVGSRFVSLVERGPFYVSTFTKNETTRETIEVALDLLTGFRREGCTPGEIAKAQKYLRGSFAIGHQSSDAMAEVEAEIAFYGLPDDYYDTFLDRMSAVTLEDVRTAASARFPADDLVILALGEASAIRDDLRGFGELREIPLARP